MTVKSADFESAASANSAIPAYLLSTYSTISTSISWFSNLRSNSSDLRFKCYFLRGRYRFFDGSLVALGTKTRIPYRLLYCKVSYRPCNRAHRQPTG
jgi:hypothetical protein